MLSILITCLFDINFESIYIYFMESLTLVEFAFSRTVVVFLFVFTWDVFICYWYHAEGHICNVSSHADWKTYLWIWWRCFNRYTYSGLHICYFSFARVISSCITKIVWEFTKKRLYDDCRGNCLFMAYRIYMLINYYGKYCP